MQSTMQDYPLLVNQILRHGQAYHGDSLVVTVDEAGYRESAAAGPGVDHLQQRGC